MSILIKGMKMPKDKEIILRIDEKGEVYNIYGSYPTEPYSAVELPPHGRLIDADAAVDQGWWIQRNNIDSLMTRVIIESRPIDILPTIIEAEEE